MRSNHCRPAGRLCYLVAILLTGALALRAADIAPATTLIQDTIYRANGTPARGTVVISFGRSRLSVEANNYFGIKARNGQPFVEMRTVEVVDGKRVTIRAKFAKFASMKDCFAARDRMILTLPCYAEAKACASDAEAFVRALGKRWATDPEYAGKVLRIAQTLRDAACRVSTSASA